MNGDFATDSERVFADLCRSRGYEIAKIPENPPHLTPDFEVRTGATIIVAEVKQFDMNDQANAIQKELIRDAVHVGQVDLNHSGGLGRKIAQQAAQLRAASAEGLPTLGVIYSNRVIGPTDYQVQHALDEGTIAFPSELSAILYVRNENLVGDTPPHTLYRNTNAAVPFPDGMF